MPTSSFAALRRSTRIQSAVGLALLVACSSQKAVVKTARSGGHSRDADAPPAPPPPVSLNLFRFVGKGTEIEARRNAFLFADSRVRLKVTNRTGHSIYIRVEQTPDERGMSPLDAPELSANQSDKGNGLIKLSDENTAPVDFPIRKGLHGGKVVLHALSSPDDAHSLADAKLTFRPQPALEFYGEDDLPVMNHGQLTVKPEAPNTPAEQRHRFYVEMIPAPLDGSTCPVALESTTDDGTTVGQVRAILEAPAYRDGPFRAIVGTEIIPNAGRYKRNNVVDGDPSFEPSSPAPGDRTELIAVGEIKVRRESCY